MDSVSAKLSIPNLADVFDPIAIRTPVDLLEGPMRDATAGFRQFDEIYDLRCESDTRTNFVICSSMRSGSHYLGHLMYSTGMLGYPLEYFHAPHLERWTSLSGKQTIADVFAYIKSRRTSPNGCFGFKAHFQNYMDANARYPLDELFPECRFILIERQDLLAQAISLVRAHQTQQFISLHEPTGETRYDFAAIHEALLFALEENASWRRYLAIVGQKYRTVTYEALVENPSSVVNGVAEYLDVGSVRIRPELVLPQRQADHISTQWRERFLQDAKSQPAKFTSTRLSISRIGASRT